MSMFGYCETCGAPRTAAVVKTPFGPQPFAVGLQCSATPEHGPDTPEGGRAES